MFALRANGSFLDHRGAALDARKAEGRGEYTFFAAALLVADIAAILSDAAITSLQLDNQQVVGKAMGVGRRVDFNR